KLGKSLHPGALAKIPLKVRSSEMLLQRGMVKPRILMLQLSSWNPIVRNMVEFRQANRKYDR
ncbi:hypothetical protein MKX03_014280, partial [Papaver bracteatum]